MEVGGPSSEGRRRMRRVGEDEGGADRISDLPDAVLGDIISLLPTKEGGRTQILASRWRHLWHSAPLNLDCRGLVKYGDDFAGVVSRIISSHHGPGRRFCTLSGPSSYGAATLDTWLQSPAVDNLQELYLCYPTGYHLPLPLLSESIFRLSTTLCVATIESCQLPETVQVLQFPQLKQLTIGHVKISECSLHHLIAGCPALEYLLIDESFGFRCLRINSVTLRGICVRAEGYRTDELKFGELIIENAPCLEKLLHLDLMSDLHVSVIFAPQLETLRLQSDPSTQISFGSTVIQGLHIDSLTMAVHSIKILGVDMDILNLDIMIDLMRCFPCLEKLYIQSFKSGPNNLWLRKHRNLIKCHDIRLKKIVFEIYSGIKSQVSFLTFFILNVRGLELMILRISDNNYNGEFLAEHRSNLKLENRASRGALIQFTADRSLRDIWDINHIRDLDLTDPFSC